MDVLDKDQAISRVSTSLGWLPPPTAWTRLMNYPFGVKTLFLGYFGGFLLSLVWDLIQMLAIGIPTHNGPIPIYFELAVAAQLIVILALWLIPMIGYPAAMVVLGLDILYQWLMGGVEPNSTAFAIVVIEGVYLMYFLFTIPLLQYRLLEQ